MKERIVSILKNFGVSENAITDDAHFIKDLGFDSLDTVDLMMQVEQEFSVMIPDADYSKITNISNLVHYLKEHEAVHA